MYDTSDPRSSLTPAPAVAAPAPAAFAGAEYARFYDTEPQETTAESRTWYARGQNFVLAYTEAQAGAQFERIGQADEYAVLIPEASTAVAIEAEGETTTVAGHSLTFVPPGRSRLRVLAAGRIVRLFTVRAEDLLPKCSNAASYAAPHPNVAPFEPWPAPPDGYRVRSYSLAVSGQEGRFGRIFRCTTFMINVLEPKLGPRDATKMSPHFHDDFEQCSLALDGAYIHYIRWPWTTNLHAWRDDDRELCKAPSMAVIPPPALHTSRAIDPGLNQLVDIFCPPRFDFSAKPGWVLNESDYPVPPTR